MNGNIGLKWSYIASAVLIQTASGKIMTIGAQRLFFKKAHDQNTPALLSTQPGVRISAQNNLPAATRKDFHKFFS
jgi:hypothetical protein